MKSSIFKDKVIRKFYYRGELATKPLVNGTIDKKIILPGHRPEKVENHWVKAFLGIYLNHTVCFTNLDQGGMMIIF